MDLSLTQHAAVRAQQRGIPVRVIDHLYRYGETKNAKGALSLFLSRRSLEDAANELTKQELQRLRRYRNSYLIVGNNERIVTVARSLRKFQS